MSLNKMLMLKAYQDAVAAGDTGTANALMAYYGYDQAKQKGEKIGRALGALSGLALGAPGALLGYKQGGELGEKLGPKLAGVSNPLKDPSQLQAMEAMNASGGTGSTELPYRPAMNVNLENVAAARAAAEQKMKGLLSDPAVQRRLFGVTGPVNRTFVE
jgi:hypothetical protein